MACSLLNIEEGIPLNHGCVEHSVSEWVRGQVPGDGVGSLLCVKGGGCCGTFHLLCGTVHEKCNSIEHRLFSAISRNWAGRPLDNWETVLNYIRTTTTKTGLQVRSIRVEKEYQAGIRISRRQMAGLNLTRSTTLAQWNYDIQSHEISVPTAT